MAQVTQEETRAPLRLSPTLQLATWIADFPRADIPTHAKVWARHALLDWFGVAIAGSREPLVGLLLDDALENDGDGRSKVIGHSPRLSADYATLVNGSASHALDYDDVNMQLHGHATVAVAPALITMAERLDANGDDLLDAFIVGYEVACRVGGMMGDTHYERGWHATATIGTLGAAAGVARLLRLSAPQTAMALGIASTEAAGLKSMFGTMCKPLHAGRAAMNGLVAARLAKRGFTSRQDAIECHQGFGPTMSDDFCALGAKTSDEPFAIESNLFKYHAACYLTHSAIEAAADLGQEHSISAGQIKHARLRVPPRHLDVCNVVAPCSGLEVKFSLTHTVAMGVAGVSTGAIDSYSDAMAARRDLVALRELVTVEAANLDSRTAAELELALDDGRVLSATRDVGVPATDLGDQAVRLEAKFMTLAAPVVGEEKAQTLANDLLNIGARDKVGALLNLV